jgi:hypothetical protein
MPLAWITIREIKLILINPYSLTLVVCVCPKPGPRFPSFTSWSFLCFPDEYCFIGYQLIVNSSLVFLGGTSILSTVPFLGVPVYCRQFQVFFLGTSILSTVPDFGYQFIVDSSCFWGTNLLSTVPVLEY